MNSRQRGHGGSGVRSNREQSHSEPLFDPKEGQARLLDELAEQQAENLDKINSSQLRRFFGEIKDLYRRFEARAAAPDTDPATIYKESIEPPFKMVRSKVSYATRSSGASRVPDDFAKFLSDGIKQVNDHEQFRLFVKHFEAVVGFMYGKGMVQK